MAGAFVPPTPCTCLAKKSSSSSSKDGESSENPDGADGEGADGEGEDDETSAFVKNLLANVREVVGFLESVHPAGESGNGAEQERDEEGNVIVKEYAKGVKLVSECAVVRCLNQLDRAIRCVFSFSFSLRVSID